MATVLVGLIPDFKRVPFLKPPDMQRLPTPLPRALIVLTVNQGVVDAKPTDDDMNLQVTFTPPVEFAYRLIDSSLEVHGGGTANYNDGGELQITNAMRGQPLGVTTRHGLRGQDGLIFVQTAQKFWRLDATPSFIIQSISSGISPVMDWRVINGNATATLAATVNFLATLYEYDIEQVQMFPPLIPSLTYNVNN
jgi:hypothetical protein